MLWLHYSSIALSFLVQPYAAQQTPIGSSFGVPLVNRTFDYVIVGAGTAGLALAYRLSDNLNNTVAVIEAGSYYEFANGNQSQVPGYDNNNAGTPPGRYNPLIDWNFNTTNQAFAYNTSAHYPRGKALGGTSARNYLIYQRGTIGSYDQWSSFVDDSSYTFSSLLPYFTRSLNFTPPSSARFANATPSYNDSDLGLGNDGPLDVTFSNYGQAFSTWGKQALEEVGMSPIQGFTSGQLIGNSWYASTIDPKTDLRESSETAFLQPALGRTNLAVYVNTLAKRVVFDGTSASAVIVETDSVPYTLSAKKEVILSGGVFQSPQLLMVSGIGPSATLQQHNIPVIADGPGVGQNMWDHVLFGITTRVDLQTTSALAYDPAFAERARETFNTNGTGMLSAPGGEMIGFEKVPPEYAANFTPKAQADLATFPADWPDLEFIPLSGYYGTQRLGNTTVPVDGTNFAGLYVALVAPLSRGTVSISSADTNDQPVIDPNWLSDPTDQAVAIAGFKRGRQILATQALKNATAGEEVYPGATVQTDEEILDVVKRSFHTVYHAAGTCAMGRVEDVNAVVDSKARVIGVQNLRVVDASSFPILPPGHPQSTVYALAEKIAEDILNAT